MQGKLATPVSGKLIVYTGPMFSGKTEHLISGLQSLAAAKMVVAAFKPKIDNRYSENSIASHADRTFPATAIDTETGPLEVSPTVEIVGIDEVQFFKPWIVEEVLSLLRRNRGVVVSGLDLTFSGHPFGVMPELLCLANEIHKLGATCAKCSRTATRSFRKTSSTDDVLVGGAEAYEPRCLTCFEAR